MKQKRLDDGHQFISQQVMTRLKWFKCCIGLALTSTKRNVSLIDARSTPLTMLEEYIDGLQSLLLSVHAWLVGSESHTLQLFSSFFCLGFHIFVVFLIFLKIPASLLIPQPSHLDFVYLFYRRLIGF
eukprot:c20631_g2_i2.p1 GENE.c20631_g2_i2~~c20631_g2_i2.p1  ORF type:complete len:127 (+),score=14.40 c20631_g2_i2:18-398(+)